MPPRPIPSSRRRARPAAKLLVESLEGRRLMTGPSTFAFSAVPTTAGAGALESMTVTAQYSDGTTDTGFNGDVIYTSTDQNAVLPYQVKLTSGTGTVAVTFATVGPQTVTVVDANNTDAYGTSTAVIVTPGAVARLAVSSPTTARVGSVATVLVTALDPYGNVATGDSDTINLTATDPSAALPGSITLTAGVGSAPVTFATPGAQSVAATDATSTGVVGASTALAVGQIIQGTVALDPSAGTSSGSGTTPMPGRVVFLDLKGTGIRDGNDPTTTTDSAGHFAFPSFAAGTYPVLEVTAQDADNQSVVAQTSMASDGTVTILVTPTSPVAPTPVVPNPFAANSAAGGDTSYVQSLYKAVLGRPGASPEVAFWVGQMAGGMGAAQVAQAFVASVEHRQDEVTSYYEQILRRAPDATAQGYVNSMVSGSMTEEQVVDAILGSTEFQSQFTGTTEFLTALYADVLGRKADASGLAAWEAAMETGTTPAQAAAGFVASVEADTNVVDALYNAYLHRNADPLAQTWIDALGSGGSATTVAVGLLGSVEYQGLAEPVQPAIPSTPVASAAPATGDVTWYSQNLVDPQIAAMVRDDMQGHGQLTYADMLALFQAVGANGAVTAPEYQDLQTIVGNRSAILMTPVVRNLASKVVGASASNSYYQGATPLGDLQIGSPNTQLATLVDKWFLGMDHPEIPKTLTYNVPVGAVFANTVGYTQIDQGSLGDCYTMSSLASIALHNPQAIQNMIQDLGNNVYAVEFYREVDGVPTPDFVTVDLDLPENSSGEFEYANGFASFTDQNNILWGALIEKAYAQWSESSYNTQLDQSQWINAYKSIGGGGYANVTLNQFTASTGYVMGVPGSPSYGEIVAAFAAGSDVVFGTVNNPTDASLEGGHDYAMVGYDSTAQTITLFNPWGVTSYPTTGMPAYVTITMSDLSSDNFDEIDYLASKLPTT